MPTLFQINVTSNWGSTGRIAESIGAAAMGAGWESYIAYGRYHNPSESRAIRVGNDFTTCIHYALSRFLDREGRGSVLATERLIRELRAIGPDIVHLHNIHDHYLNYPLLFEYLNSTDIKLVWTMHDTWAFTGHCKHFVECDCTKWRDVCGKCPMRDSFFDNSMDNFQLKKRLFSANRNLSIIPVSEWLAGFVRQSFFAGNDIRVIHNGVDLNVFVPPVSRPSDKVFRVIAVSGKWPAYKGLDDVIALRSLLPPDCEMTVVGLSEKQIGSLPSGIKGMKCTQRIRELVDIYGAADVLVNTTYADTFPTVNLEALACGTPVVTYRTGGSPETIDEKTGVVVTQGDVEAMASSILWLREHPLSREDCRMRAEALFDKDKCFEQYVGLYKQLNDEGN